MFRLFTQDQRWERSTYGEAMELPNDTYLRDEPQAHASWLNVDGSVLARCSLWWADTPAFDGRRLGIIGHYAAVNSEAGARLLDNACKTLLDQQCDVAIGPMDGNTWRNYRAVIQSDGSPPFYLEPNHQADCLSDFAKAGFTLVSRYCSTVCEDLTIRDARTPRLLARMEALKVFFRSFDLQRRERDLRAIYNVTLAAFEHSFLFHPIDFNTFRNQFEPLLERLKPHWIQMAEQDNEAVGFVFGFPDFSQQEFGQPPNTAILKTLAVLPAKTYAGLGMLLLERFHGVAFEHGYGRVIHALMHEDNSLVQALSSRYAKPMRRYGLFTRELA